MFDRERLAHRDGIAPGLHHCVKYTTPIFSSFSFNLLAKQNQLRTRRGGMARSLGLVPKTQGAHPFLSSLSG